MIDPSAECAGLVEFARASAVPAGFGWLDAAGRPDPRQPVHAWITCRMTYVFALEALQGRTGAAELAAHGVASLAGPLHDDRHGGWYAAVSTDGDPVDHTKAAYAHAFVVLAAGTAAVADLPGARDLLDEALGTVQRHFLDERGRVVDTLEEDLRRGEAYRGANSSMHMVEAFLVAGDVTGDPAWHTRALAIAEHLVHGVARSNGYLLPEHYDVDWNPLPEYNAERPDDPFRPYGATPGHLLEWSRLLLHLEGSVAEAPGWLAEDTRALFGRAVEVGWEVDGAPGFVYTVDWRGRPVVRLRMHWVHAEALAAADALHQRTGETSYAAWRDRFAGFITAHLVDRDQGSWHHELDERNRPSATVWDGKPDVYHAYQALLLTRLRSAPCPAVQLRAAPSVDWRP